VKGQDRKEVTISAHLSDMQIPSLNKEMKDAIDKCKSRRKNLTTDCDTSAHYIMSASTDTNPRGGSAMNYLLSKTPNILNTFAICNRSKVLTWY